MYSKDELYYIATDLLRRLIATPSVSREEEQAAQLLYETLEKNRFTPHRTANNVWALAGEYDPAKPTLLLNSHIDTVKPVASWNRDPFTPTEEEGRLYGHTVLQLPSDPAVAEKLRRWQEFVWPIKNPAVKAGFFMSRF